MSKNYTKRLAGIRGRAVVVAMALTTVFATLGAASATAAPKGEYEAFAECPTSNAELSGCISARAEGGAGGSITFGSETVPIVNTQTLQGGFIEEASGALKFVAAANGNTLTKTAQKVPGGLSGLVNCTEISNKEEREHCEAIFENKFTGVNATVELAAPASSIVLNEANIFQESGVGLALPVKVKVENPFLGNECYIGSNASPLVVELTTGTSGSLKGKLGEVGLRAENRILVIKHNSLVNNTIAVPGANGCGGIFSSIIDKIVDGRLGIPAAAPKNKVTLNGTLEQTSATAAREHE
ncbi:MAG: hypothetical protein ACHQQS_17075 [Thermoanaerobaculales bacterium]